MFAMPRFKWILEIVHTGECQNFRVKGEMRLFNGDGDLDDDGKRQVTLPPPVVRLPA